MDRPTDYVVCVAETQDSLSEIVRDRMKDGWICQGGASIQTSVQLWRYGEPEFMQTAIAQAMIR